MREDHDDQTCIRAPEAERLAAAIDAQLAELDDAEAVIAVPELDWSWDAASINTVLRALFDYVQLDESMRPLEAVWRVPEWRAAQPPNVYSSR